MVWSQCNLYVSTWWHKTHLSDSNGMPGAVEKRCPFNHPSIGLDCTDAQDVANGRLMDQSLWQFSSKAVQSGYYKSIAFNDWWGEAVLCHPGRNRIWHVWFLIDKQFAFFTGESHSPVNSNDAVSLVMHVSVHVSPWHAVRYRPT